MYFHSYGFTRPITLPSNSGRISSSFTISSCIIGLSGSSHAVLKKNLKIFELKLDLLFNLFLSILVKLQTWNSPSSANTLWIAVALVANQAVLNDMAGLHPSTYTRRQLIRIGWLVDEIVTVAEYVDGFWISKKQKKKMKIFPNEFQWLFQATNLLDSSSKRRLASSTNTAESIPICRERELKN